MWALLASVVWAQGIDDESRLLGPDPVAVEAAAPVVESPSLEMPPWWTVPLVGLGLVAAWTQRKKRLKEDVDAMRVLGRTALGKDSVVVMLEVRDADGGWRRLLLGSSPQGTQLLTELGGQGSFATEMDHLERLPEVRAVPVMAPTPVQPVQPVQPVYRPVVGAMEEPGVKPAVERTIGPARLRAAALHGELGNLPGVRHEPPPVREPKHSVQEGMDLLAEVRRKKGRLGTRIQAYG